MRSPSILATVLALTALLKAQGQPAPQAAPDTLILSDGERLLGHFVRSTGGNVIFKSDVLGELTIGWAKIKELRAAQRYVVIGKKVELGRHSDTSSLSLQGGVSVTDQDFACGTRAGSAAAKDSGCRGGVRSG